MESITLGTYLWTTLGAFLTICIFSFLYKDNPLYKIAEHIIVGVAAGYFVIILWHNGLIPNLFNYLRDGNWYLLWLDSVNPHYMIPALLGAMMWARFSKKWSWVSRWPIAIYMGIATGYAIPLAMKNNVIMQFQSSMRAVSWNNFLGTNYLDPLSGYSQLLIFVGMLAALFYFFFSTEHSGIFKGISKFGIMILMIGFGATFGFTVMARISLFVQRIQTLGAWSETGWSSGSLLPVWIIVIALFIVLAVMELVKFIMRKSKGATA